MEFFKNNRLKLLDTLKNGDLAVVYSGKAPIKCGDEYYQFTPDRNFYYLTGLDKQNMIYITGKINDTNIERVYIEPDNGQMARWVGANITPEETKHISGIEDIKFIDDFKNDIIHLANNTNRFFTDFGRNDIDIKAIQNEMRDIFGKIPFEDLYFVMEKMRVIKSDYEISLIKKAADITRLGIEEMMKNAKAGMNEYELEAYYDFVLKKNGVKDKAFKTIVASGMNGTILHYVDNNNIIEENTLVLVDAGAQWGYYSGDISRTFPVSGKFTERQKLVYNIVLNGQKLIIDNIKPNIMYTKLNDILKDYYYYELLKLGLVKTKEDVFNYYFHGVSHFIGAQTHDVGDRAQALKPGMVISVEPGLYIKEWGIGIRIEDDVLVTETGCDILTSNMIKTIDDIEKFMAEVK